MINVITDHEISELIRVLRDAKSLALWGDDEDLMNECQKRIEMLRNMRQIDTHKAVK